MHPVLRQMKTALVSVQSCGENLVRAETKWRRGATLSHHLPQNPRNPELLPALHLERRLRECLHSVFEIDEASGKDRSVASPLAVWMNASPESKYGLVRSPWIHPAQPAI